MGRVNKLIWVMDRSSLFGELNQLCPVTHASLLGILEAAPKPSIIPEQAEGAIRSAAEVN